MHMFYKIFLNYILIIFNIIKPKFSFSLNTYLEGEKKILM